MRISNLPFFLIILFACTKKAGHYTQPAKPSETSIKQDTCSISAKSIVSFSATIYPIVSHNCGSCHTKPGLGSINLDTYDNILDVAKSGELMPVILNTDSNSIRMPPPPYSHLDSCTCKALLLWIQQGYQDN